MKRGAFQIASVLLLVIVGYAGNASSLNSSLPPGISFMFGSVAVLLSASLFGPISGLLAGIVTALPTMDAWGHSWAVMIMGLEGLVCGLLLQYFRPSDNSRISLSITSTSLIFWALLGGPISYAAYRYALTVPLSSSNLIVAKWAINGVLNAALAEFLLFLLIAPNAGGWLRAQGAQISRWRAPDMYVASIVVASVTMVLVTTVIESRHHVNEQYNAQRKHQENTLAVIVQLLPSSAITETSLQQRSALNKLLQSSSPRYALRISTAEEVIEFGDFPVEVTTEGPAYEAIEPTSNTAHEMQQWLDAYMVTRMVHTDGQSTAVLVGTLRPLIDSLWKNTANVLATSAGAVLLVVLLGFAFSRYATRSLTQLAHASALMKTNFHHDEQRYSEILADTGFEPKEAHDLRKAIGSALREEARAHQASLAAVANTLKIVEEANAPIVAIDMEGAIVGWNRASERATGLKQEEVIGQKTEDVLIDSIPPVDSSRILKRLRNGGSLDGMRLSFKNTDGRRVTLLLSGVVLNDVNGEPNQLIMVGQNLTDYLEQEQQLLQASKMSTLGEMATGMAHELNQPLNAIRLTVANLRAIVERKPDRIDALPEKLDRINNQIDRATKIIDHLRLYGRRSDGLAELSLTEFSPDDAIRNGISLFQEQFRIANITLTADLRAENALVKGDSMLFEQVLINLLSNARDAIRSNKTHAEPAVQIATSLTQNAFQLVVEDTGGGVENHVLDHMFEPFYTSKAPGQGTGLGLSIAYSTISGMGGTITASNGPHGLCVTMLLPPSH